MNRLMQAVIFDMDGVLCDSEPFICEAACRMFAERYGLQVNRQDFVPFVGTGENRYLGGVAEKYGIQLDVERDKARTYEIYLDIIKGHLKPLPGVLSFVADCRRRGLRMAIATSADLVKMEGNLKEIGLPQSSFDAFVTGNELRHKKPHPEPFLTAAHKLGLAPQVCLVIEDAPNGVLAAKTAGCRCLGITSSFSATKLMEAGADYTAPDLDHVPAGLLA